jgi:toxin ParE1/3/4
LRQDHKKTILSFATNWSYRAISPASADNVLDRLVKAIEALKASPDRGSHVNEFRSLGISEYRQNFFKPYRLIYRLHSKQVIIYVIADSRRDVEYLLARRLLGT